MVLTLCGHKGFSPLCLSRLDSCFSSMTLLLISLPVLHVVVPSHLPGGTPDLDQSNSLLSSLLYLNMLNPVGEISYNYRYRLYIHGFPFPLGLQCWILIFFFSVYLISFVLCPTDDILNFWSFHLHASHLAGNINSNLGTNFLNSITFQPVAKTKNLGPLLNFPPTTTPLHPSITNPYTIYTKHFSNHIIYCYPIVTILFLVIIFAL